MAHKHLTICDNPACGKTEEHQHGRYGLPAHQPLAWIGVTTGHGLRCEAGLTYCSIACLLAHAATGVARSLAEDRAYLAAHHGQEAGAVVPSPTKN